MWRLIYDLFCHMTCQGSPVKKHGGKEKCRRNGERFLSKENQPWGFRSHKCLQMDRRKPEGLFAPSMQQDAVSCDAFWALEMRRQKIGQWSDYTFCLGFCSRVYITQNSKGYKFHCVGTDDSSRGTCLFPCMHMSKLTEVSRFKVKLTFIWTV